ncbi:hypothetical protein CHLRE_17g716026v5 [Chlamydomonas reinhardtii]|uniref:Uncharacterized protein n=1 Tax=Chlamydomonas reinhardtii TaxID=3055 RepID=A0A2K3CQ03_CHLRE|nr:uncharacterized protein CHLRE_17g716026v5 [Chlamydomonas reinhardtii]PNW70343.1 hypothetical protein CHLRE_17g716026v5 [Chlamydomonas reinhardtii]
MQPGLPNRGGTIAASAEPDQATPAVGAAAAPADNTAAAAAAVAVAAAPAAAAPPPPPPPGGVRLLRIIVGLSDPHLKRAVLSWLRLQGLQHDASEAAAGHRRAPAPQQQQQQAAGGAGSGGSGAQPPAGPLTAGATNEGRVVAYIPWGVGAAGAGAGAGGGGGDRDGAASNSEASSAAAARHSASTSVAILPPVRPLGVASSAGHGGAGPQPPPQRAATARDGRRRRGYSNPTAMSGLEQHERSLQAAYSTFRERNIQTRTPCVLDVCGLDPMTAQQVLEDRVHRLRRTMMLRMAPAATVAGSESGSGNGSGRSGMEGAAGAADSGQAAGAAATPCMRLSISMGTSRSELLSAVTSWLARRGLEYEVCGECVVADVCLEEPRAAVDSAGSFGDAGTAAWQRASSTSTSTGNTGAPGRVGREDGSASRTHAPPQPPGAPAAARVTMGCCCS